MGIRNMYDAPHLIVRKNKWCHIFWPQFLESFGRTAAKMLFNGYGGRTPLAEDFLISSVRGGGAELGRCEAKT